MADRLTVRVEFKRALWTCPKCGTEDIEDMSPAGGNTYEHNCSRCGAWFNSFKEYNGVLQYPLEGYDKVDPADIDKEKQRRMDAWIVEIKNPVIAKEPTKEELEQVKLALEQEIVQKTQQITEVTAKIAVATLATAEAPKEEPIEDVKPG
jgi:predicted RNA-binding Zn-ribbon protein involved in translation (DUF1610 family)